MKTYAVLVVQTGSGSVFVEAESEQEARDKVQALIDAGQANVHMDSTGWDDERIDDVEERTELSRSERENMADNAERYEEMKDTGCMYNHDHSQGGCEWHD